MKSFGATRSIWDNIQKAQMFSLQWLHFKLLNVEFVFGLEDGFFLIFLACTKMLTFLREAWFCWLPSKQVQCTCATYVN